MISNFRPTIDFGDFYQLKAEKFCWLILAPIAYQINQTSDKAAVIGQLSNGQKALYYWWYLATHSGWGLRRFLELGFGGYLPMIIDGLILVGNKEGAKLLQEVYGAIKKEEETYFLEEAILKEFDEKSYDFSRENVVFFEKYIRNNPDDFITVGTGKKLSTQLDGTFKTYFSSGQLKHEFTLENGLLVGEFKVYSKKGILLKQEFYEQGVLSEFIYYHKNGLKDNEVKKEGSGTVKINYTHKGIKNYEYHFNERGERHGLDISYRNGNISRLERYANDKRIGVQHNFYEDGAKKTTYEGFFDQAKMIYFWDRNGKMTVRNGNGQAIREYKHSDGVEKIVTNYSNGVPDGVIVTYINEEVRKLETYKDGQQHGPAKSFSEDGQLESITIYENGKEISSEIFTLYIRKVRKISLVKPQIVPSNYVALLNKMGFSGVKFNGKTTKENVTDYHNIGVFIANFQNVTIVITQDNSGVYEPRQTTFTEAEKQVVGNFPNAELLFINHFQSPFAQSIHYIKNGASIRVLEKDSRTVLFSEGTRLKEEKEFSRVYYQPIAVQYELIKRITGCYYPDIPMDLTFHQFVTNIDLETLKIMEITKGEQQLIDIFNNRYVNKRAFSEAIIKDMLPELKKYGFQFDAQSMKIHRIKDGVSQAFHLVQPKKNFEVIIPLSFYTQVKVLAAKQAINTKFLKDKDDFKPANYYPNPLTINFEEDTLLSFSDFMNLFKTYFFEYYLVYFESIL